MSLESQAARIKLLLFDVDGVLTDGTVIVHADGTESKVFGIRDGIAIVWAQRAGLTVGLLSARTSATTLHRAAQLGISIVEQGVLNKLHGYERIVASIGVSDDEVAYMADDIVDLGVLARVGLSAAPADAVADVRARVHWVSDGKGGSGAVREFIELILRAQDRWNALVASYSGSGEPSALGPLLRRRRFRLREGSGETRRPASAKAPAVRRSATREGASSLNSRAKAVGEPIRSSRVSTTSGGRGPRAKRQ